MKKCKICNNTKEYEYFHKCKTTKDGYRSTCKECRKIESTKWYNDNKEKLSIYYANKYKKDSTIKDRSNKWKIENKEKHKAYNLRWNKDNSERKAVVNKKWYEINKDKVSQYKKNNRGLYNSLSAKRRAAEIQRTPSYANLKIIQELYEYASYLTKTTGIIHHVDHIIPLQGKTVSGFHIESNLQVIPKNKNLRKSNKFTESGFYGSCIIQK